MKRRRCFWCERRRQIKFMARERWRPEEQYATDNVYWRCDDYDDWWGSSCQRSTPGYEDYP